VWKRRSIATNNDTYTATRDLFFALSFSFFKILALLIELNNKIKIRKKTQKVIALKKQIFILLA